MRAALAHRTALAAGRPPADLSAYDAYVRAYAIGSENRSRGP
jgi:hypothetical protein